MRARGQALSQGGPPNYRVPYSSNGERSVLGRQSCKALRPDAPVKPSAPLGVSSRAKPETLSHSPDAQPNPPPGTDDSVRVQRWHQWWPEHLASVISTRDVYIFRQPSQTLEPTSYIQPVSKTKLWPGLSRVEKIFYTFFVNDTFL